MSLSDLPTGTVSEPTSRTYPSDASIQRLKRLPRPDGGFDEQRSIRPSSQRQPSRKHEDGGTTNVDLSSETTEQHRLEALQARVRQLEAELEHVESERQAVIDHYEGLLREQRIRRETRRTKRQGNEHPIRRLLGL
ncbi:hypothetical protein AUR64_00375 [Haloprofundus marisrubri]|uniref:Uncharacterized protein n=1 Tax=Haloprofundus marisrubri TaxID=1514971 RepID=A0A0W1RE65_9EURY|nr:hypothetical protein [Haloprofundus marisrubri]KTG11682.1 hypothetical protein AUR64_00375 [Haloprofundus marisrubri]